MLYKVKTICDKSQIERCEKFFINQYMWDSIQEPKVYGWMGYLEGQGLFAKMVCEESNPKREFTQPKDPVCEDSAMEVFVGFAEEGKPVNNNSIYLNYEVNANGAMYAGTGHNRNNRQFISDEIYALSSPTAVINNDNWYMEVLIPEVLLKDMCDFEKIKVGETFYCNFYKIAECEPILHFGSYSPMTSEKPDFHVQTDFAQAIIVK